MAPRLWTDLVWRCIISQTNNMVSHLMGFLWMVSGHSVFIEVLPPPSFFFFTPLPCPNVSPWFKSIDWTGAVVMTKDSWFMWSAVMSSFRDQRVTVIISIKDLLYPVFYRNMTHKLVSKHTVFMKLSMLTEGGNTDGGMKLSTYFPTTSLTWLLTRAR